MGTFTKLKPSEFPFHHEKYVGHENTGKETNVLFILEQSLIYENNFKSLMKNFPHK